MQKVRTKTGWLGIRIVCPSGATCLSNDYGLFSPWYSRKIVSFSINKQQSLTHSCYNCDLQYINWIIQNKVQEIDLKEKLLVYLFFFLHTLFRYTISICSRRTCCIPTTRWCCTLSLSTRWSCTLSICSRRIRSTSSRRIRSTSRRKSLSTMICWLSYAVKPVLRDNFKVWSL